MYCLLGRVGAVPEDGSDVRAAAERFAALFRALYLTYHRRDGPRSDLPGASRAVLTHLAVTGPLTVGEAAAHLGRAQSVVSEIVDGLARKGLLERERDPDDRRRTLVWLTARVRRCCAATGKCCPSTRSRPRCAACPPTSAQACSPGRPRSSRPPPLLSLRSPQTGRTHRE